MTIEEVAKKWIDCRCDEAYTSRNLTAPDCPYHSCDPEEAMKEWAKAQAIAYTRFVNRKYVVDENNDDMYWDNDGNQFSENMLYDLFLKSQSVA